MEKDISIKDDVSKNEQVTPEIDGDTNTTIKVTEKDIVSASKTGQVLIGREDCGDDDKYLSDGKSLHINDGKILSLLHQETGMNYYSFTSLMRKLNLHQQSLARALNRLQDVGLIDKSNKGYALTKTGILMLSKSSIVKHMDKTRKGKEYVPLFQTFIDIKIRAKEIVHSLIGKWFKSLRWGGLIENETECVLQWISDDNSFQINLRVMSGYVTIETNATSDKEKIEAMAGSCRIFEQIIRILQNRFMDTVFYPINLIYDVARQNN
ncbi:MAG TPA: winged helix-turn-helix domain-containing protein [Nitrososphaeraceae archaeon]|nr:winged helix-turn-helix domain-containing protein [Nitrososphaeraceae archaeon]